jgi:hypothetical protein
VTRGAVVVEVFHDPCHKPLFRDFMDTGWSPFEKEADTLPATKGCPQSSLT